MTKKRIVKISVIALSVLLFIGGIRFGLLFLEGESILCGDFPKPDRVVVSYIENGEIVERELTSKERWEIVLLFEDLSAMRERGIGVDLTASDFFDQYERYGIVEFLYDSDRHYIKKHRKYCACGALLDEEALHKFTYNAICFVISDIFVYAYEGYNGTIRTCHGAYLSSKINRNELLLQYFLQKEG